jgi:hypothetical protein
VRQPLISTLSPQPSGHVWQAPFVDRSSAAVYPAIPGASQGFSLRGDDATSLSTEAMEVQPWRFAVACARQI